MLHCVTVQGEDELAAAPNAAPSKEETDIILRQKSAPAARGPSHGGIINDVINELENTRRTTLKEWTNLPRIGRELFLILNADRRAKLAGINISYDSENTACETGEKEVKGRKEKEFNLLDEPWIRVMTDDCSIKDVSLTHALLHAHQYVELAGELPTARTWRHGELLLAVLYTVFSAI